MIMRKKKGIIRHETLKPLSRHHMVALHTAVKLKRAGKEESRLTVEEIINDVREFWIPDGIEHFREEEKILLVTYAKHVSIDQPIIHEMLMEQDRKSTRLNSSHVSISYAVFCLKKKKKK